MSDWSEMLRDHDRRMRAAALEASAARTSAAWTQFVKGVWLQFKREAPRGTPSLWVADRKTSLRKLCGYSQAELIARTGVETKTVRRMRVVLSALLEIGEGQQNPKGQPRPAPPKETFKRYMRWADAEKASRETLKRNRAVLQNAA